jgi:predicted DNA-binding protein YlxM (UPF0122 family)
MAQPGGSVSFKIEIDDFIHVFKDIYRSLQVSNKAFKDVLSRCSILCQNFQTSLKIYNKFDSVWSKLALKDASNSLICNNDKLKRTVWMIYLISKHEIIDKENRQIVGNHVS